MADRPETSCGVHCPECGYDLTGSAEARCPECGFAYHHEAVRRLTDAHVRHVRAARQGTALFSVLGIALALLPLARHHVLSVLIVLLLPIAGLAVGTVHVRRGSGAGSLWEVGPIVAATIVIASVALLGRELIVWFAVAALVGALRCAGRSPSELGCAGLSVSPAAERRLRFWLVGAWSVLGTAAILVLLMLAGMLA